MEKSVLSWIDVAKRDTICLYAGDIYPRPVDTEHLVGLSLKRSDHQHIVHDVTWPIPLEDNSVFSYQAEDVFEHIPYADLVPVINEIYRVLEPDGMFRLSMPDYRCDVLRERSEWLGDKIVFDHGGGGDREHPGHVWFPVFETTMALFGASLFEKYAPYHYYAVDGTPVTDRVDYSKGYISRTPDHDKRVMDPYRPMSIIIDAYK